MARKVSVTLLALAAIDLFVCVQNGGCDFITQEGNLRAALFANYNVKVRPDFKTHIYLSAFVTSLNQLDIAKQFMSVNLIFNIEWFDGRLAWNATDHGGLEFLVTAPEDVWTPPIVIENAVSDVGVMGGKDRDATPLRISSTGLVGWGPPSAVATSCEMSIAHYPFDTQSCSITLIGWTYPLSEMNVSARDLDIVDVYSPHGEFDLTGSRIGYLDVGGPAEAETYRKVSIEFTFRRKWQFYGQNLILPIILNSILMNAVFALPIESGEKMGFCLTVLLSYIVFLTWVTDNLPRTSTDTSILQVYLAVVLCLGVLATLLTTWILHLYHSPSRKPMKRAYRKFATAILVPLMVRTRCLKMNQTDDIISPCKQIIKVAPLTPRPVSVMSRNPVTDRFHRSNSKTVDTEVLEEIAEETKDTLPTYTWQEIAVLFDYFFLWLFAFVMVVLTALNISMLYTNY